MKIHDLKTWPVFFAAIACGDKAFEVREDDRDFQVGDVLVLREWVPPEGMREAGTRHGMRGRYTGHVIVADVTYVMKGADRDGVGSGVHVGYCVMGIRPNHLGLQIFPPGRTFNLAFPTGTGGLVEGPAGSGIALIDHDVIIRHFDQ